MPANYDLIVPIYDLLAGVVYGRQIVDAQVCMLRYIAPGSHVLIIGGGTGWILDRIAEVHAQGLEIDYVESSAKMIARSKKRHCGENKVTFLHMPVEDLETDRQYDIIITAFLFDNFRKPKIDMVFDRLDRLLAMSGRWLYADFVYQKNEGHLWQGLLLKVMYLFFRICCGIETMELVSMSGYFANGFMEEFEAWHYHKFIRSVVYRKNR